MLLKWGKCTWPFLAVFRPRDFGSVVVGSPEVLAFMDEGKKEVEEEEEENSGFDEFGFDDDDDGSLMAMMDQGGY